VGSGDREQNVATIVSHLAHRLRLTPFPHLENPETHVALLVMHLPERLAMQLMEVGNNHCSCPFQLVGAFEVSSSKKNCVGCQ
jgi:hypothetical protein